MRWSKSLHGLGYSSLILTYLQPEKQQLNSDSRLRGGFFCPAHSRDFRPFLTARKWSLQHACNKRS
jgi:hypothetical protein